jgi:purine-nucleoside phosphorylase
MPEFFLMSHFEAAAAAVRERVELQPGVGLILGSGLNPLADAVEEGVSIPYSEIPHFPVTTVEGHLGRLVVGRLEGQAVAVMQGRAHYYEGYSMAEVNAAGGLNQEFRAGDVMLITDHINLIGMSGLNPLRGPNLDGFGPRFPDMSEPYDSHLRMLAKQAAAQVDVPLQEGVYVCLAGPSFETRADLRFLRLIGADAVGMSTVPEVTVARHGDMRALGLSGISNIAPAGDGPVVETSHEEVLEAGRMLVPKMAAIIRGVLRAL